MPSGLPQKWRSENWAGKDKVDSTALRLTCRECSKLVGEILMGSIEAGAVVMCLDCQEKVDRVVLRAQTNQRIVEAVVGEAGRN